MSELVIVLRDVWKFYVIESRKVAVLKGVNATIRRGEIVAIHGPSGAGKTTLLKILAGLEMPDKGEVIVDGYLLTALDDDALATLRNDVIGFIPQDLGLIEELTVFENIELPLLIAGVEKEERRKRVEELVEYIGLRGKEKLLPRYLSGGERQRVAIARALANVPSVILADEPTANLDWENARKVLQLFDRIRRDFGTTIVIVTHDPRVLEFADRRFLLEDGVLREIPGL